MSIFITDLDANKAAQGLCDDHLKEYPNKIANLCKNALSADYITGPTIEWCKISKQNLEWMINYGIAVCNIYTAIYMKNHLEKKDLQKLLASLQKSKKFESLGITKRIFNMPSKYAKLGFINANREVYRERYRHLFYSPCRMRPKWLN